ncbi:MAG: hypothetical protein VKL59_18690 [Nostocaceae cyanobacterium]|nr:hypothetical protein [Nostocaceae cyanobacterium]
MSKSSRLYRRFIQLFAILLGTTIALWLLRGFGVLGFMPGGVLVLLLLLAIATGIVSYLQKTVWRF